MSNFPVEENKLGKIALWFGGVVGTVGVLLVIFGLTHPDHPAVVAFKAAAYKLIGKDS